MDESEPCSKIMADLLIEQEDRLHSEYPSQLPTTTSATTSISVMPSYDEIRAPPPSSDQTKFPHMFLDVGCPVKSDKSRTGEVTTTQLVIGK